MSGGASTAEEAGSAIRTGILEGFRPKVKAAVGNAYDQVGALIDPAATTDLAATRAAAQNIINRRAAYAAGPGKAVETISPALGRPGGLTYQGIKDLRTSLGEMLDTGNFPEGMSQAELRHIYGALSNDLKASVSASGGADALAAFERANSLNIAKERWTDALQNVLRGAARSNEGITNALYRMSQSGAGADARTLTLARSAVPPEAWENVSANIIGRLGVDKAGDFSPALFVRDYGNLSDIGKRVLFDGVGKADLIPHLDDIAEVSRKFVQAGKLGNPSGTAHVGATYAGVGAGAMALFSGDIITPLKIMGGVFGNNMLARFLASTPTAASVASWARAYNTAISRPSTRTLATLNIATRNLASNTGLSVPELQQRIQSAGNQPQGGAQ